MCGCVTENTPQVQEGRFWTAITIGFILMRDWSNALKSSEELLLPVGSLAANRKELSCVIFTK